MWQLSLSQLNRWQLNPWQFNLAHRLSRPPQSLWQLSPMPLLSRPGLLLWRKNRQLSLNLLPYRPQSLLPRLLLTHLQQNRPLRSRVQGVPEEPAEECQ